jgi:hypothetical protein
MPNWQPNWDNVRWDWGAADNARAALCRAADRLDETNGQRVRRAAEAQAEWRGRYRDKFDGDLAGMVARSNGLAAQFRDAAGRIAQASQRAWEERRHRENERARWQREKEEEERRERKSR